MLRLHGKLLLSLLLFFSVLAAPSITSASEEKTYQITETQLNQLEQKQKMLDEKLATLETIINKSGLSSTEALKQIAEQEKQLKMCNEIMKKQDESLTKANNSIENANKFLAKSEEEAKQKNREIALLKTERTLLMVGIGYLLIHK